MTTGQRIRSLRLFKGMSQEELGAAIGVKKAAINKYENGTVVNLKHSTIQRLANALDTTPAYIMGWEQEKGILEIIAEDNDLEGAKALMQRLQLYGIKNIQPMPRFVRKPRLGTIACGKPILAVEEAEEFDDVPEEMDCDFTLRCKGDSMINARIFEGDIVYIRTQPQVENGEIAAVRIGDEATLKKVYYTPGSDRITLQACNPLYPDMVYEGDTLNDIQILGKAVAFTSTIR